MVGVVRKGCGYANLYIGTAEHEGDIPSGQVTLSIFRAAKPEKLFREMAEKGQLKADAAKGIYHVEGITDLPFQIVITGELEGPEYAAFRALTDHARCQRCGRGTGHPGWQPRNGFCHAGPLPCIS